MTTTAKTFCLIIIGSMVLAFLAGCTQKQPAAAREPNAMSSQGKTYPFALDEVRLRALVEKASQIKLGATRQEVKASLGAPWEDMAYAPKETNKITGRFVKYYATKSSDMPNNHDEVVTFYFDNDDRLVKISSNIPAIPSRP